MGDLEDLKRQLAMGVSKEQFNELDVHGHTVS
jgi:hypothetical protein